MTRLPNHTALKEWSSAIEAIGRGDQVILIRKGGIADPRFGVEAEKFYLFPTFFHQPDATLQAGAEITHWCEVVRMWRVSDLKALHALEPLVVFSRQALEERYRFRVDQALHVIGIRAWRLAAPVVIAPRPAYEGCRSWVSIEEEIETESSTTVLAECSLAAKLADVEIALGLDRTGS